MAKRQRIGQGAGAGSAGWVTPGGPTALGGGSAQAPAPAAPLTLYNDSGQGWILRSPGQDAPTLVYRLKRAGAAGLIVGELTPERNDVSIPDGATAHISPSTLGTNFNVAIQLLEGDSGAAAMEPATLCWTYTSPQGNQGRPATALAPPVGADGRRATLPPQVQWHVEGEVTLARRLLPSAAEPMDFGAIPPIIGPLQEVLDPDTWLELDPPGQAGGAAEQKTL